jgi:O-antigen ligase
MTVLLKYFKYTLLVPLIIPFVFLPYLIFPFVTTKVFFFCIVIDILFVLYLIILTKKKVFPEKSKLLIYFFGITLISFLLDLFGLSFQTSFWGNYERMLGIYTVMHVIAYLWMILSFYKTKKDAVLLLQSHIIISAFVILYSFLQKFDIKILGVLHLGDNRISALFGNPSYLAVYLLFTIYFAALLFTQKRDKFWRIISIVIGIFGCVSLSFTGTRGAFLGLLVSLFFVGIIYILYSKNDKYRYITYGGIISILVFLLVIFVFYQTNFIKNNSLLSRFTSISLEDSTTQSRLVLWNMGLKASKDKILFGYGRNNISTPLDHYHDEKLTEHWFDSSHNQFIDELLAHGIVGLIIYLFLLGFILKEVYILSKDELVVSLCFFGLFIAYIVQNIFLFDTFISYVYFVLSIGLLIMFRKNNNKIESSIKLSFSIIYISIGIICISSMFINYRAINAAYYTSKANHIAEKGHFNESLKYYKMANDSALYGKENIAGLFADTIILIKNNKTSSAYIIEEYIKAIDDLYGELNSIFPEYSRYYVDYAKLYQYLDKYHKDNLADKSIDLLIKAKELSTNRVEIDYAIAQAYILQNDIKSVEEVFESILLWKEDKSDVYFKLALFQFQYLDANIAVENLKKAILFGKKLNYEQIEKLAHNTVQKKEWKATRDLFILGYIERPNDKNIIQNVILACKAMGDTVCINAWEKKLNL